MECQFIYYNLLIEIGIILNWHELAEKKCQFNTLNLKVKMDNL